MMATPHWSKNMRQRIATAILISLIPSTAFTQNWDQFVMKELECKTPPSPGPIIASLADAGAINVDANLGYDSMSCFRIKGEVRIAGLKVNSVCGFEEDASERIKFGKIFYRGPGTSPGQFISFGTSANDDVVANWYRDNIGHRHLNEAISSEFTNIGDKTEITCSSWFSG